MEEKKSILIVPDYLPFPYGSFVHHDGPHQIWWLWGRIILCPLAL